MSETTALHGRTVLVTGADGFIGRHTCARLAAGGAEVRRATRRDGGGGELAVGEVGAETDWGPALAGVEVVVHLAARVHVARESSADPLAEYRRVNVAGTRRLAAAAVRAGVRRLVLVSSIGVLGREWAKRLDETAPPRPETPYARSKLEAEEALLEVATGSPLEPVIVRPPLVYGPDGPGNLVRLVRLVSRRLPLPLGAARNRRSYLYVGNLADLLALCVIHPAAAHQLFLASDGEDLTTVELVRLMGEILGRRAVLVPVPRMLLTFAARVVGRAADVGRLFGSLEVDSGKARRRLDWQPPYTAREGLAATLLPAVAAGPEGAEG